MAWNPLGTSSVVTVVTAGTPVQVKTTHVACQSILIQALPQNTGRIVVGSDNTVRAGASATNPSGTVLAIIGAPTSGTATPPSATGGVPTGPAALDLQQFWVDAQVSGEGVIVSYLR